MSSWLRNIQGQLSDLANEVLNEANDVLAEAREEVADPDAELTVAKKKCAEAEKQLAIEAAKCESLESEKKQLEQQLYDSHVEMDAIGVKLNGMVRQRDDEIKKLKNQINQINDSGWNDVPLSEDDQLTELRSQVAHWKSLAESGSGSNSADLISLAELERRLEEQRQRKEHEIQALVESHAESMVDLREMYEEKLAAMQVMPYNASSSTSNADTLDAVMLEKEDFGEVKKGKSSTSDSDERPVVVDLGSHDELVDERIHQVEAELERCKEEKLELQSRMDMTVESLRAQNKELAFAYNELNSEFEEFKTRNTATETRNNDLILRIDSLKANLIEYEERYELCKNENMETVAQLEKLSSEFERLRTGVANVTHRRENADTLIDEEVEKLRAALDESRSERERLREDVQRFTVSVGEIDVELEKLRDANRQLLAENQALTQNLSAYDQTMKDVISNSEKDIGQFREQFRDIQENHSRQREAVLSENAALREETEAIKKQRDILMEESHLLKEVNAKLKQKSTTEESKLELLTQKAELLQKLLDEEREKKEEKKEEEKKDELPPLYDSSQVEMLRTHLREALEANTEKSEECETLKEKANSLEREVELRQNCVDEMIAQTNTLQLQQETLSAQNKTLQNQILANERQIVQLEEAVREEKLRCEAIDEKVKTLEGVIVGGESQSEEEDGADTDKATMKRYIQELQSKLKEVEEELRQLKTLKEEGDKDQAEARSQLERDLFEAEEVDRGLLESIEARVRDMEGQLISKVEQLEDAKKERSNLEKTIAELTLRIEQFEKGEDSKTVVLAENNHLLEQKLEQMEKKVEEFAVKSGETEKAKCEVEETLKNIQEQIQEIDSLRSTLHQIQQENQMLKEQLESSTDNHTVEELRSTISRLEGEKKVHLEALESGKAREEQNNTEVLQASLIQLQQENEYLKGVAQTHHDENVKYYEQCQAMVAQNQSMQSQMEQMHSRIQELDTKISTDSDSHEKKAKELQRLREHLMIVEENSTREAVESEQRETELRARVRELEAKGHAVAEGASESTQQYQVQIASLTSKVESLERTSSEWKAKYESEVKMREQTQEALTSLQNIVRELSVDHERDSATASHRNLELQSQIATLNEEILQIREELDRQSISRQAAEEETDRRKLQLDSKQKIIEELENQIEELRSPAKSSADSYRIDDSTLRQLFLNYFNAEPAKRADIAMLLASILEYPPDEMDKFRQAVRQSLQSTGGSFFFGSRASPGAGGASITEQFIRFLEVESESSRTAPHLPVRNQSEPPAPQMSLHETRQLSTTSPSNQASSSSSAAALDSLLR